MTGRSEVTTAMFTNAWPTTQVVSPAASSPENVSGAWIAIRYPW